VKCLQAILLIIGTAFAAGDPVHDDPDTLLRKIQTRTAEYLAQLPHYTCHEVINRLIQHGGRFTHTDTVEIEVAFIGHQEFFARSGEDRFDERQIDRVVPHGTIGNGSFGSAVQVVFSPDVAQFHYVGSCNKEGHRTVRFNFKVPLEKSQFLVKHGGSQSLVPYEGTVWVDAATFDLVRVDLQVKHIPAYVGLRWIDERMHYEVMPIGGAPVLLPRKSELGVADESGNYGLNMVELRQCREFTSDSIVKYGAPVDDPPARDRHDPR